MGMVSGEEVQVRARKLWLTVDTLRDRLDEEEAASGDEQEEEEEEDEDAAATKKRKAAKKTAEKKPAKKVGLARLPAEHCLTADVNDCCKPTDQGGRWRRRQRCQHRPSASRLAHLFPEIPTKLCQVSAALEPRRVEHEQRGAALGRL